MISCNIYTVVGQSRGYIYKACLAKQSQVCYISFITLGLHKYTTKNKAYYQLILQQENTKGYVKKNIQSFTKGSTHLGQWKLWKSVLCFVFPLSWSTRGRCGSVATKHDICSSLHWRCWLVLPALYLDVFGEGIGDE